MEPLTSTRALRRPKKRNVVAEEFDEDEATTLRIGPKAEAAKFTPGPGRSPGKRSRRNTTDLRSGNDLQVHQRVDGVDENRQPSEVIDADSVPPIPKSPTKRTSPRKRDGTQPLNRRRSSVPMETFLPLTSRPSMTPDPIQLLGQPLSDITNTTINEQEPLKNKHREPTIAKPMETALEKPMDIVLRTRALGAPTMPQPDASKTRLVIRHLVLINFKSYAGRQEVGPFHSSFSSVVGPNGSGKSNVIDSLLFVFGFRASKMRQGKISALIHNSAKFQDLDFCEVEVHFEEVSDLPSNMNDAAPSPKLVVSRKVFKNNSSKYFINGKESNFTTVTALLKDRGIDLDHKRFLILQGEVESIAQMKPKASNEHDDGLLEYLEDIIGTSKYKNPIEESASEFETLNEVCIEKHARVQHVEKERSSLEDKKNKALAYIRDENELACKHSALYQIYIEECQDNLGVTEEAVCQTLAQLDEELKTHQGNEEEIKRMEKTCKQGTDEYNALERQTIAMTKEFAKMERESIKFDEKHKFLAVKQQKLEKTLQASRLAVSEAGSFIQRHDDDVLRTTDEIAALEEALRLESDELARIRESLTGRTQQFSDAIVAKRKQLEPWAEKISQKESTIALTQSELDILRERASSGQVALEELQIKMSRTQEARKAKLKDMGNLRRRAATFNEELEIVGSKLGDMAQREPDMRSQISVARQKADDARASLSNSQSQSNVLKGLMRMKESGRIEGFHGRLGGLGTIDNKYDVAISTACPSLENMVVDTVEVGQKCIDYLRQNSIGRANFILIDRLGHRDLSVPDTPEGVPRLFDLIRPKSDMFRPAFFSVLQNTLVADNLEQANRIAYGARRWRVVTLDGHLIDVSGTMSGGGTRVARGGMSSKLATNTTGDQVSKLETDRDDLERDFQAFQDELRALEVRSKTLTAESPSLETLLQKTALEIESCDRHLADAEKSMTELAATQQPSQHQNTRVAYLEKRLHTHEKERDMLRAQTSGLEAEIQELNAKIMEVGGVKLRGQKARVDGLKEQIETLGEENSSAQVSRSKATKDKAKHEKAYVKTEFELAASVSDLEKLDKERKSQAVVVGKAKQKNDQARSTLDQKGEAMANMKKELEVKAAQLNETRAVEIDMRNKLDENRKAFAENQKRLQYWTEKLSKLTLHSLRFVQAFSF